MSYPPELPTRALSHTGLWLDAGAHHRSHRLTYELKRVTNCTCLRFCFVQVKRHLGLTLQQQQAQDSTIHTAAAAHTLVGVMENPQDSSSGDGGSGAVGSGEGSESNAKRGSDAGGTVHSTPPAGQLQLNGLSAATAAELPSLARTGLTPQQGHSVYGNDGLLDSNPVGAAAASNTAGMAAVLAGAGTSAAAAPPLPASSQLAAGRQDASALSALLLGSGMNLSNLGLGHLNQGALGGLLNDVATAQQLAALQAAGGFGTMSTAGGVAAGDRDDDGNTAACGTHSNKQLSSRYR